MKLKKVMNSPSIERGDAVAQFGNALLIRQADGKYRLAGGSRSDHTEAKEWASMFLHEAVLDSLDSATPGDGKAGERPDGTRPKSPPKDRATAGCLNRNRY
jgi:hypothetical protein